MRNLQVGSGPLFPRLHKPASSAHVRKLLDDTAFLQQWQLQPGASPPTMQRVRQILRNQKLAEVELRRFLLERAPGFRASNHSTPSDDGAECAGGPAWAQYQERNHVIR